MGSKFTWQKGSQRFWQRLNRHLGNSEWLSNFNLRGRIKSYKKMARSMLHGKNISKRFWAEAVNTACHTVNIVYLCPRTNCTPYEICNERKPNLSYFRIFGSKCYILVDNENVENCDSKSDEGIFLG